MRGVQAFFATVPDERASNARHALGDIPLIALAATLCGAETCVDIAAFGRAKRHLLGAVGGPVARHADTTPSAGCSGCSTPPTPCASCAHWSIENHQHWLLDVAFNEDAITTSHDNAAQNLAILRRLALNLLRQDTAKASFRTKIKQAGWQDAYPATLLSQMRYPCLPREGAWRGSSGRSKRRHSDS